MRDVLGAVAVAVPFLLGLSAGGGSHEAFRFQDADIIESSGAVVDGDLLYTTNDSGDSGRIFAVDTTTGETVGVTHWADAPTDVEALAPAGPGEVWVADIGDNGADRDGVEVARVPVGRGDRDVSVQTFTLTYPHGRAVDAESLLCDPQTGRLYVVTKEVFGGTVYAAPRDLAADGDNELKPIGSVGGLATDGAFFPDGKHLIVRSYGGAEVHAWPSMRLLATFDLPDQDQGEGIAVAADDSLWLTSEGLHAPVLNLALPADVRRAMSGATSSVEPVPSPAVVSPDVPGDPDTWPWLLGGLFLLGAVVGAVAVLLRSLRPR